MNENRKLAGKKRQEYDAKVKKQVAGYALVGLRRSDYAGVFQKINDHDQIAWLAEIKLDGFQRSLFVKLCSARDKDGNIRRRGMLQGLHVKPERRSFDLIDIPDGGERFQGIIELQDARLIINVIPASTGRDRRIYLCHLEVVRSDA
ncbi:hypothetical protein ACLGGT_14715 [Roseovarius sp. MS2]|uniref:hypothetical protein n=1 Tax=Roseovarius sp. MS2 TaxID=3390728 RepID=UPI003EDC0780